MSCTQTTKRKRDDSGAFVVSKRIAGLSTAKGIHTYANGSFVISNDLNKIVYVSQDFVCATIVIGGNMDDNTSEGYQDGRNSLFSRPSGLAADRNGNVLVADKCNHCIRRIHKDSGKVNTMAGCGQSGFHNAKQRLATFNRPEDVVVLLDGSLAVSDSLNHCVRVTSPNGRVWTLCGGPEPGLLDATGDMARFDRPSGLAVTRDGHVLVIS